MIAISDCLLDTNILLRISRKDDPDHAIVDRALSVLAAGEAALYYTFQNVTEYWNVATRPVAHNGFGLSTGQVAAEVQAFERNMRLLIDNGAVYREWRRLVVRHAVSGVQVHDARLAAAMRVHGIPHLLTLNPRDSPATTASRPCIREISQTSAGRRAEGSSQSRFTPEAVRR